MLRLFSLLGLAPTALADRGNIFPVTDAITDKFARNTAVTVAVNTPTVVTLVGWNAGGNAMEIFIDGLPKQGKLYETSQNYRVHGLAPFNQPLPIKAADLPFKVTDVMNKVVYIPPSNKFANTDAWDTFTFHIKNVGETAKSDSGIAVMCSPAGAVAASDFSADVDGWTVVGNGGMTTGAIQHMATKNSAKIDRYVFAIDTVQYFDLPGKDERLWYFQAPSKYLQKGMKTAYNGFIQFDVKSSYGSFGVGKMNHGKPWLVLECQSCDSGRGMRLVYLLKENSWDGLEKTFTIQLKESEWQRDPLNAAKAFTQAQQCEMIAVLSDLTKMLILGDYTRAQEGIMMDNVKVVAAASQPSVPDACHACTCTHKPASKRASCCAQAIAANPTYSARRLQTVETSFEPRQISFNSEL